MVLFRQLGRCTNAQLPGTGYPKGDGGSRCVDGTLIAFLLVYLPDLTVFNAAFDQKGNVFIAGLFSADQNLRGNSAAKHTRQNPNANRRGYECPEERDYFPYWHPSEWKDVAVLAENASRCAFYKSESFNVKPKRKFAQKIYCIAGLTCHC